MRTPAYRHGLILLSFLLIMERELFSVSCSQMNKFFKPALSLLLELKLGECSIEKRLYPLTTFLTRHRSALQKYIYPECFATTMKFMWDYILQVGGIDPAVRWKDPAGRGD